MRDHSKRLPRLVGRRTAAGAVAVFVAVALCAGCSSQPPTARIASAGTHEPVDMPAISATMGRSAPVRLQIPAIDVDATFMDLGLQDDGTLEVPPEGFPAGWYTGGPTPGELGPAIIAGHVDWAGAPGVFAALRRLEPSDEVKVLRQDGSTAVFRITRVEQFPKNTFPTELVYDDIPHAGLRLITCGGSFDRQVGSYTDNVVAFAELVGSEPTGSRPPGSRPQAG